MPELLAYLAQSAYGKGYFLSVAHRTTNLASINSTKLKALPVLLPSLEERGDVVETLQVTDNKIAAEEKPPHRPASPVQIHAPPTDDRPIRLLSDGRSPVGLDKDAPPCPA